MICNNFRGCFKSLIIYSTWRFNMPSGHAALTRLHKQNPATWVKNRLVHAGGETRKGGVGFRPPN